MSGKFGKSSTKFGKSVGVMGQGKVSPLRIVCKAPENPNTIQPYTPRV